jgi:RNA polymerase sigma-70 factor (ECF subfamily)
MSFAEPIPSAPISTISVIARPRRSPVAAHDDASFERALVALTPELLGRALRLTGSQARAEDVLQDTLERALRFRHQYVAGSNLRAWAHQVLFSVFVTSYRRSRRERRALRVLGDDPVAWTTPEAAPQPTDSSDLTPSTQRELQALPEGFRKAIELIDLEERSYREAADALGVPLGTVMSRLHRGRKLLAERLRAAA